MTFHCLKRLIKVALLVVICGNSSVRSQDTIITKKSDLSSIERTLAQDALKNINEQLNNKKGTLERISCRYEVAGANPLSASIKTFYVDYRKTTDAQNYAFKKAKKLAKCDSDQIVEIIYKANEKNQLTIVSKKNRRRSCKYVAIA